MAVSPNLLVVNMYAEDSVFKPMEGVLKSVGGWKVDCLERQLRPRCQRCINVI